MRRVAILIAALAAFCAFTPQAEESGEEAFNIDSLFDEPPSGESGVSEETSGAAALDLRARGIVFDAGFEFWGGVAPGWSRVPWSGAEKEFTPSPGAKMRALFGVDARISSVFRVKTSVFFEIPGSESHFAFRLGEFFFDYNMFDAVFVRGGKYNHTWGISPNYGFTNLLARVPPSGAGGDSYILKADIPIGVGGFQALAITRTDLDGGIVPGWRDIGVGGKFNIAIQKMDFDAGALYQNGMPARGFFSVRTTLGETELYYEWLIAISPRSIDDASMAANLGFARDFFDGSLTVNGELYFNGEDNALFYIPETTVRDAEIRAFPDGLNLALNLVYRINWKGNPRVFMQALYAPLDNSAQIVPGIRISPLPHVECYLAIPMALGSEDGYYFSHNADRHNRPFSVTLAVTLSGNIQRGFNF